MTQKPEIEVDDLGFEIMEHDSYVWTWLESNDRVLMQNPDCQAVANDEITQSQFQELLDIQAENIETCKIMEEMIKALTVILADKSKLNPIGILTLDQLEQEKQSLLAIGSAIGRIRNQLADFIDPSSVQLPPEDWLESEE
ncbi:hypothetical protein HDE_07629 [Halotydeus destructor]|nr:hypothetical protein HDE_07629 [Halotydeus destructor]